MTRIICDMRDNVDMDFTTFGGLLALTNGLVLRVNNGDGTFRHLHNFKDNGNIIEQASDHRFLLPKPGNSIRGFTAIVGWGGASNHDAIIRLDGTLGQGLELIVQDDLTGSTHLHWNVQGREL